MLWPLSNPALFICEYFKLRPRRRILAFVRCVILRGPLFFLKVENSPGEFPPRKELFQKNFGPCAPGGPIFGGKTMGGPKNPPFAGETTSPVLIVAQFGMKGTCFAPGQFNGGLKFGGTRVPKSGIQPLNGKCWCAFAQQTGAGQKSRVNFWDPEARQLNRNSRVFLWNPNGLCFPVPVPNPGG